MSIPKFPRILAMIIMILAAASNSQAVAEPTRKGDLAIETPWARASIGVSRPAAAYLTIRNEGSKPEVLTGVSTSASKMAEVHEVTMVDGISRMGPAGAITIPAGSEVSLKPGGLHVMMMKLKQPLEKGESLDLTLTFKNTGPVEVLVPILGIGASGPGE